MLGHSFSFVRLGIGGGVFTSASESRSGFEGGGVAANGSCKISEADWITEKRVSRRNAELGVIYKSTTGIRVTRLRAGRAFGFALDLSSHAASCHTLNEPCRPAYPVPNITVSFTAAMAPWKYESRAHSLSMEPVRLSSETRLPDSAFDAPVGA